MIGIRCPIGGVQLMQVDRVKRFGRTVSDSATTWCRRMLRLSCVKGVKRCSLIVSNHVIWCGQRVSKCAGWCCHTGSHGGGWGRHMVSDGVVRLCETMPGNPMHATGQRKVGPKPREPKAQSPPQCQTCGRAFAHKGALATHQKTCHEG